jgi:hypothetical protein
MPIVILPGVEGSIPLPAIHCQNQTTGKVSATTQNGLMALEMMPDTFQSVLSLAQ